MTKNTRCAAILVRLGLILAVFGVLGLLLLPAVWSLFLPSLAGGLGLAVSSLLIAFRERTHGNRHLY